MHDKPYVTQTGLNKQLLPEVADPNVEDPNVLPKVLPEDREDVLPEVLDPNVVMEEVTRVIISLKITCDSAMEITCDSALKMFCFVMKEKNTSLLPETHLSPDTPHLSPDTPNNHRAASIYDYLNKQLLPEVPDPNVEDPNVLPKVLPEDREDVLPEILDPNVVMEEVTCVIISLKITCDSAMEITCDSALKMFCFVMKEIIITYDSSVL
ncbi:hypothetical protein Tco_0947930 [Tanacetum coccineum]